MVTYSLMHVFNSEHHSQASILALDITKDESFLFSAGSDSLVKIWDISSNDFSGRNGCVSVIYSLVDIGDIFSIVWCEALLTIFIGAQNASILWCKLPLHELNKFGNSFYDKLPHFRYDKFFDSKGPGGSINTLQSKQQLYRKNSSSTKQTASAPKLYEISSNDFIRFAHNGYVYCMDIIQCRDPKCNPLATYFQEEYDSFLISCGGDGIVNIWGLKDDAKMPVVRLKSLENGESILSMSLQDSHLYVGLSDSTINVWDLSTFQLIRSFNFTNEHDGKTGFNEVLSLGIHNDCIFKASNIGGLVKFTLKNYPIIPVDESSINENEPSKNDKYSAIIISPEDEAYYTAFNQNVDADDSVLTVRLFDSGNSTYLVSGGNKALCVWDISNVGSKSQESSSARNNSISNGSQLDKYSNEALLKSLHKYISYKTISKFPTLYLEDSRHCAQFLFKMFVSLGSYQTKLFPVEDGNPIVYASFKGNKPGIGNKPKRLLWYAHYDVVDATKETDDWETDPFTLTARDGNLYARGISDNKGPSLAAIYAVAELYEKQELSCDVVFIIEGEEECGSIGFQQVINEHKDTIGDIDWIMLSNSYWIDDITPCLNYGLRGVINGSIIVRSDHPDRHSGVDGGVSREPTMDLIQVLSQLIDPSTNEIKIPGFYDDVLPLTEKENQLYQNIESRDLLDQDLESLKAKWRNPSLTIHKIHVSGPNNNTVIPQQAQASVSIRIVPNQDLAKIKQSFESWIKQCFQKLASENHITVDIFHEAEPWLGDPFNLVYNILARKIEKNWGIKPLFIREGGSIPSVRFLEKCFDAPAAQIPCGQSSDNAHLKDEKLRIINLYKLRSILTDTLTELGS